MKEYSIELTKGELDFIHFVIGMVEAIMIDAKEKEIDLGDLRRKIFYQYDDPNNKPERNIIEILNIKMVQDEDPE